MGLIAVINAEPYKGEYDLEPDSPWTVEEWHWVKKISGYLPLTLRTGIEGADPELIVAMTAISMRRSGRIKSHDVERVAAELSAYPFGDGQLLSVANGGGDAGPPAETPSTTGPSASGGESSREPAAPSDNDPEPTGHPA